MDLERQGGRNKGDVSFESIKDRFKEKANHRKYQFLISIPTQC